MLMTWAFANFIILAAFAIVAALSAYFAYEAYKNTHKLVTSKKDTLEEDYKRIKSRVNGALDKVNNVSKIVDDLDPTITQVKRLVPELANVVDRVQEETRGMDLGETIRQVKDTVEALEPLVSDLAPMVEQLDGAEVEGFFNKTDQAVDKVLELYPDVKATIQRLRTQTIPAVNAIKADVGTIKTDIKPISKELNVMMPKINNVLNAVS